MNLVLKLLSLVPAVSSGDPAHARPLVSPTSGRSSGRTAQPGQRGRPPAASRSTARTDRPGTRTCGCRERAWRGRPRRSALVGHRAGAARAGRAPGHIRVHGSRGARLVSRSLSRRAGRRNPGPAEAATWHHHLCATITRCRSQERHLRRTAHCTALEGGKESPTVSHVERGASGAPDRSCTLAS